MPFTFNTGAKFNNILSVIPPTQFTGVAEIIDGLCGPYIKNAPGYILSHGIFWSNCNVNEPDSQGTVPTTFILGATGSSISTFQLATHPVHCKLASEIKLTVKQPLLAVICGGKIVPEKGPAISGDNVSGPSKNRI